MVEFKAFLPVALARLCSRGCARTGPGMASGATDRYAIVFNPCQKNPAAAVSPLGTGIGRLFKESPKRQKNAKKWVDRQTGLWFDRPWTLIETFSINPEQGEQRRSRSKGCRPITISRSGVLATAVAGHTQSDWPVGQPETVIGDTAFDTCHLLFSNVLTLQRGCNIHAAGYNKIMVVD